MTDYRNLTVTQARALLVERDNRRGIKGLMVFALVGVFGVLAIIFGQVWARNADVSLSTLAFGLVAVPAVLVWLIFHNFNKLSRRMERLVVVLPSTFVLAIVIAVGVANLEKVNWTEALWGFGAFVFLLLFAGVSGALCVGTNTNNIGSHRDDT